MSDNKPSSMVLQAMHAKDFTINNVLVYMQNIIVK